jgi:hypothetical protein
MLQANYSDNSPKRRHFMGSSAPAVARNTHNPTTREATMTRSSPLLPLLLFTLAACGASRSPVPLVGESTETTALTGEWAGEYSSGESGRSGSITFTLRAAGDSAFGDVVMIPSGLGRPVKPYTEGQIAERSPSTPSTVLTIRFVRVEHGRVSGTLDPYADPQTGERLFTTFIGDLKGNAIEGTYTTRLQSGVTQTGRWSVLRRS